VAAVPITSQNEIKQPKQQTSQKQKKAPTATTLTTGSPGKKSVEEATKEEHHKSINNHKQ
jgi:hypothetical protein